MNTKLTMVLLGVPLIFAAGTCQGQQNVNTVVDNMISSYGGDKLAQVKTLKLSSRYKGFRYGQSIDPDDVDMQDNHFSITLDLENRRNSFRWVRGNGTDFATQHQLFDGKQGYRINHASATVIENNGISYQSADRHHVLNFDTAIVVALRKHREQASYDGQVNYLGGDA